MPKLVSWGAHGRRESRPTGWLHPGSVTTRRGRMGVRQGGARDTDGGGVRIRGIGGMSGGKGQWEEKIQNS